MDMRSFRLPPDLWKRLEAARYAVNERRVRRISMSSILRALLERGLEDPGRAFEFGARIYRPERARKAVAELRAEAQAQQSAATLRERVNAAIDRLQLTPAAFAAAVGGDRRAAEKFYHAGQLPDSNAAELVDRLREWLSIVDAGATSPAG
jgi:hypothetical protein